MKVSIRQLYILGSVLFSVWLLSGCYYDPSGQSYNPGGNYGAGGGYAPGYNNAPGYNSNAYKSGVNYGRQDGRRGLSRKASRHWYVVPTASRETFANGYLAGYKNSGGGGGPGPGQQAYSQGLSYGGSDARQGYARQASRHWNGVQLAHRQSFAQGYNAGYARN